MEIVHYPHPALRWKAKPIREINQRLRDTVREMFQLMYASRGIGLAANQVALPWRVFVINPTGDPADADQEFVFINPEITARKGTEMGEEGCLSLPELYGQVRRAEKISVEAYDLQGQLFEMQLDDLPARVIQHELDHLDGVLFIDRLTDIGKREAQAMVDEFVTVYRNRQNRGEFPPDAELEARLKELEPA